MVFYIDAKKAYLNMRLEIIRFFILIQN